MDIITAGNIEQPGAHFIHIGTLRIEFSSQPEVPPVGQALTVERAVAADREVVAFIGIDQRGKIVDRFALHAGRHDGEIFNFLTAVNYGIFCQMQMGAGFEEK